MCTLRELQNCDSSFENVDIQTRAEPQDKARFKPHEKDSGGGERVVVVVGDGGVVIVAAGRR